MIKNYLLTLLLISSGFALNAQNLINNGSFEDPTSPFTSWVSTVANGNLWGGPGGCGGSVGTDYIWGGDQTESMGINNLDENLGQVVTLPANALACTLRFDASVNTQEQGATPYDEMEIILQTAGGSFLTSLGALTNAVGDFGFNSCQPWAGFFTVIPAQYHGQTVRIQFEWSTDGSLPTIFRIDNVDLTPDLPCTYNLSTNNYTLTSSAAGNFSSVSAVQAANGCTWDADVVSGSSWLSTNSSGSGNGDIDITVTENTSINARFGTIDVEGTSLTIEQPGRDCEYILSNSSFLCPNHTSGEYTSVALISADNGCAWDAEVTLGNEWLISNSSGNGSGTIDILVLANPTQSDRVGQISVGGQTLLITQPFDFDLTGLEEEETAAVRIFPNPADDQLTLQLPASYVGGKYQVFNGLGSLVLEGGIDGEQLMLDVSALPSGSYQLSSRNGSELHTTTFMKR